MDVKECQPYFFGIMGFLGSLWQSGRHRKPKLAIYILVFHTRIVCYARPYIHLISASYLQQKWKVSEKEIF
jgi:hypothetical protein